MTIKKIFTALAGSAIISTAAAAAPVGLSVSAEADTTVVEMADQLHVRVRVVSSEALENVRLAPMPEPGTEYNGVDILSVSADTLESGQGKQVVDYDFLVQAFDPGMVTLPPFGAVAGTAADTAFSGIVTLKVVPVDVDSLETINPLAPTADARSRWYDYVPSWTPWVLLALALCALAAALIWYFRRRKVTIIEKRTKPVPPYELAIARLNALAEQKLAENGREKAYYTELVDILRQYLEGRFGINAMEMTSPQIIRALRSKEETRLSAEEMKTVLEIADFVKFAKVRPMPDDNTRAFRRAMDFVESTRPAPEPEEGSEGEGKMAEGAEGKTSKK
ncbi:MAG: cell wall anchor protein [Muribaculaceae bacterium]|nr:cell wall anchor protein [Muribaculaceae bacterium]